MSSWDGKTRGGLTGYRIFIFILKTFGLRPAYFLLNFVALYFFLFSRKPNRHIFFFYRRVLGYGNCKARLSVYRNYRLLGQVLIDKVAVMSGLGKHFTYEWDGEEHLLGMQEGGLLVSAHIGSWEIAGNFLYRTGKRFNILMYDEEHQKIKSYLDEVMHEKNLHVIPIKDDLSHVLAIRKALAANELIALHADRYIKGSKTITCRFMGREARFPEGPFYLALKFGAPVSFVFAMKESRRHYHFFATPPRIYQASAKHSIPEQELLPAVEDYISQLEKHIGQYPLQWFNYHRFWEDEKDDG
jgi:predicted LPLAT superfamily acyltransferase